MAFSAVTFWLPICCSLLIVSFVSFYVWRSPMILLSCLLWSLFYTLLCQILLRVVKKETIEGYPRWSYYASSFHQGVTLPILLLLLVLQHTIFYDGPTDVSASMWTWLQGGWSSEMLMERMIHCSIIGAMLKDYWVYGDHNEWFFLVHHILTIAGCSLCLSIPEGVGFVTLNALNAEIVSVTYNFKMLFPCIELLTLQLMFMGVSNLCGLWITVVFCQVLLPWYYLTTYTVLGVLILCIRCGGWAQALKEMMSFVKVRKTKARKSA